MVSKKQTKPRKFMNNNSKIIEDLAKSEYKHGFVSDIEQEFAPKGLNEDIVRFISEKKNEVNRFLDFT